MSALFGNKNIKDIFFGNKAVTAIYRGSTLVWKKGSTGYVKYHLKFEWSGNNDMALLETLIDGTTAGNRLVDGGRYDGEWHVIESDKIASLRNATQTGFYGSIVELNFNATNISSIGFRTAPYYTGQSTYTVKVIGEDSAGNTTVLHQEDMSVSTGQTYTFNI